MTKSTSHPAALDALSLLKIHQQRAQEAVAEEIARLRAENERLRAQLGDHIMGPKAAAEYAGVDPATIWRWRNDPQNPLMFRGGKTRKTWLDDYLARKVKQ